MKNKLLSLIMCLMIVGCLCGCDKKEENKPEETSTTTTSKVITPDQPTEKIKETSTTTTTVKTTKKTTEKTTKATTTTVAPTTTTVAEPTTTAAQCKSKKFSNKYSYVYKTFEECKKQGNYAFFDVVDNVDSSVFVYECDLIKDDCGEEFYGVSFMAYAEGKGEYKYYY